MRVTFLSFGLLLATAGCADDPLPGYADDLMGTTPGTATETRPDGGMDAAVDGSLDGAVADTCTVVDGSGATNALTFDDPVQEFAPASAYARYRADCSGVLEVVLTEDPSCGAGGTRQLRVSVPDTALTGSSLSVASALEVGVAFNDADGTSFANNGSCATSSGIVRLDAFDLTAAGNATTLNVDAAQLYDCTGLRSPLTLSGTIDALLDQTFADACP